MPALFGLALAAMLIPSPAARAGSWTYVVTGDNTGTTFTDNGMPGYVPPYTFKDAQGNDVIQPGSVTPPCPATQSSGKTTGLAAAGATSM